MIFTLTLCSAVQIYMVYKLSLWLIMISRKCINLSRPTGAHFISGNISKLHFREF